MYNVPHEAGTVLRASHRMTQPRVYFIFAFQFKNADIVPNYFYRKFSAAANSNPEMRRGLKMMVV